MQTSKEIARKIDQITREIADIERSLPVIYDRGTDTEQEDAEVSLVAHQNRLKRLQARLEDVRQEEHRQGEQAKREALERQRDEAREQFQVLTQQFDAVMLPLEQDVLDALDELDRIAWARDEASRRYSGLCFDLKGGTTAYSTSDDLSTAYGWRAKDENDPSGVRRALFPLYASRHKGVPGGFDDLAKGLAMKHQADKAYDDSLNAPRPQQAYDTDFDRALDSEVNRYFK